MNAIPHWSKVQRCKNYLYFYINSTNIFINEKLHQLTRKGSQVVGLSGGFGLSMPPACNKNRRLLLPPHRVILSTITGSQSTSSGSPD